MDSVYLILVHANTNQLRRLLNRLCKDEAQVYLHIDLKCDIGLFEEYRSLNGITFISNRVNVSWGAYSMVKSVINSFKEIVPRYQPNQYVSLISGQDYPLMQKDEMNRFLSLHQGKAFMEFYPIYGEWTEAIARLEQYHMTNFSFPGNTFLESVLNKWLPARKPPQELEYVGKSQWFTITIEHIEFILNYLATHPKIERYFSLTWGSDEIVFQTILYSSKYKAQMINNNLRYIDWTEGGASPKILTIKDRDSIQQSGKFFARKFDCAIDSEILDWIDSNLLT